MTMDEALETVNKARELFEDFDEADKLRYIIEFFGFAERLKPLADKYDPAKPKKFFMKRLDEI